MRDADFQVIPTAWVLAAEARWKPDGGHGLSMTAMALDPAGGGRDSAELARRYGGWYAELITDARFIRDTHFPKLTIPIVSGAQAVPETR